MKKKTTLSEEDQALFRQLMAGTRKIKQDTIVHRPQRKKISEVPVKRLIQEQADASHYFSDEFQPLLNTEGPVKYVRPDVSHFEAKKLRRGDYSPELFLDLHGLTQLQAKQELGALIAAVIPQTNEQARTSLNGSDRNGKTGLAIPANGDGVQGYTLSIIYKHH